MPLSDMDLIYMVMNAGLMVQFVLLLLLLFSIISWAIILIKYRYIRRAFSESEVFAEFFWKSRDLSEAFGKAKQLEGSPMARIFRIGYLELKKVSQSGISVASSNARSAESDKPTMNMKFVGIDNIQRALRRANNTTRQPPMNTANPTNGNSKP